LPLPEGVVASEKSLDIVRKHLKEKVCFGLKVEDSEVCKECPIASACAPMRAARLAYEKQLLDATEASTENDADFEARMESMSKAKFEAMIDKALNRRTELEVLIATVASRQATPQASANGAASPPKQRAAKPAKEKHKGRPRTAKAKSGQVLALAAKGLTRQAIASKLGISLASVYRILKENR